MRVYLPLRVGELAEVSSARRLPARGAYGVTAAMRHEDPAADEEDLEFDAMCAALDAAAALPASGRRVVAAADLPRVPTDEAHGSGHPAADVAGATGMAYLGEVGPVDLAVVVSFHVEETAGAEGEGYDALLWYDVTEVDALAAES